MARENYLEGYGSEPRQRPPRTDATNWQPGQGTVQVTALCCPSCGSIDVSGRDNGRTVTVQRFQCQSCNNSWRLSTMTLIRALILR